MLHKVTLSAIAMFVMCRAFSQGNDTTNADVITRIDGTLVKGKVIQVSQAAIEVDPEGEIPFLILKRVDVSSIKYSNGAVVDLAPLKPGVPGGAPPLQRYVIEYSEPGPAGRLLSGSKITNKILEAECLTSAGRSDKDRARSLETNCVFVDSKGMRRELRLVCERTGGIYSKFKAHFYVDGVLIETKFDKYASEYQWINSTIPGERFLLTALEYTFNNYAGRDIIGAIDRLDGPPSDNARMKRLAEVRTNTTTRPMVLMDESWDLATSIFKPFASGSSVNFFRLDETFYLGKDNILHRLRVETELASAVVSASVYIDNKLVKQGSTDLVDRSEQTLSFDFVTEAKDRLQLNVSQLHKKEMTRRIIVSLLE